MIDSLDGTIARTYNQTSKLGAKLDIYSDLLYWPVLILLLSHKYNYPNYLLNLIRLTFMLIKQLIIYFLCNILFAQDIIGEGLYD